MIICSLVMRVGVAFFGILSLLPVSMLVLILPSSYGRFCSRSFGQVELNRCPVTSHTLY
jgi:hypothetical protein